MCTGTWFSAVSVALLWGNLARGTIPFKYLCAIHHPMADSRLAHLKAALFGTDPSPSPEPCPAESEGDDYDGPRLGEPVKFTVLVGPEEGANIMPIQNGGVYVTPQTAYQMRQGEWVDLEIETEALFRSVATYVDPQAIREEQSQRFGVETH